VRYKYWTPSETFGGDFTIDLVVYFPKEQVWYRPGALETLKFGWIQYLCLFVPVNVLLWIVMLFTFTQQILETKVVVESDRSSSGFQQHQLMKNYK
jgi:hypothetical protein